MEIHPNKNNNNNNNNNNEVILRTAILRNSQSKSGRNTIICAVESTLMGVANSLFHTVIQTKVKIKNITRSVLHNYQMFIS